LVLQQLSDSLLEREEVKAMWAAKERTYVQAIEQKAKLYDTEIASLSKELSEVRFIFNLLTDLEALV